jgi:hypothetical protein
MVSELDSKTFVEIFLEMVLELELEMATGMLSDCILIAHVWFEEIHIVRLAPILLSLLFFVSSGRDSHPR